MADEKDEDELPPDELSEDEDDEDNEDDEDEIEDQEDEEALAPEPEDPGVVLDVDGLDVTLSFSLGSVELSVAQLRALQAGHIFSLDAPLASPVQVFAGRRRVGEGELIELDGRVGVRMLRFSGMQQ